MRYGQGLVTDHQSKLSVVVTPGDALHICWVITKTYLKFLNGHHWY